MSKTIDIFLKSYRGDFKWLYFALKSIERNVTGYNHVILLIPERDKDFFDTRQLPARTLIHYVPDEGTGWLRQQWYKMTAYKYCYADFIMFSDSDCFFTYPINLQDYIADGRPEILYTEWAKVGDAQCWKKPTEAFMKELVPYEMMRRNCLIYHRSTLVNIGGYAPNLESIIMNSDKFSEFNAMSAYAYKYEREKYNFVNTDEWTFVPAKSEQIWSHANKNGSDVHLKEYIRSLETIMKVFGINPPE